MGVGEGWKWGRVRGKKRGGGREEEGGGERRGEARRRQEEGRRDCGDLQTSGEIKWAGRATRPLSSPGRSGLGMAGGRGRSHFSSFHPS